MSVLIGSLFQKSALATTLPVNEGVFDITKTVNSKWALFEGLLLYRDYRLGKHTFYLLLRLFTFPRYRPFKNC